MTTLRPFKGTKQTDVLHFAIISDVHLGHQETPTEKIIESLMQVFPDNASTAALDLIFITGDLFDKLLLLPEDRVLMIEAWVISLLRLCKKHNIVLRVLEGTPSHDYKQSRMFTNFNDSAGLEVDLKYVDRVSIESFDQYGMTVLYVPDEMGSSDQVWSLVQEQLSNNGVSEVDFAMMHGCFEFQLPLVAMSESTHRQVRYESIVRRAIIIGHDHTPKQSGKIWVPGSLERLKHGEEEAKGHLRVHAHPKRTDVAFVRNEKAKVYKTVPLHGKSLADIFTVLDEYKDYPPGSAFRLKANRDDPVKEAIGVIRDRYFQFHFKGEYESDKPDTQLRLQELEFSYTPIDITSDNLQGLLSARLSAKGVSDVIRLQAEELLTAVL